jgi:hypothetical protein
MMVKGIVKVRMAIAVPIRLAHLWPGVSDAFPDGPVDSIIICCFEGKKVINSKKLSC